ncbi:Lrp/AsnC family transcriptional regulator [Bacillus thuringiensis]|uniref:Transcriptional regulator n=1 Tax=Bacillus thuringiensis TaxID=1428 RepID=A0A9W3TFH3_BACTU|nr:Lrp/AsnC family transcriptional regulator [Bacillus thuringiensis]AQY39121.1 transcriptional regulator [Bacillus thuringiensis]MDR4150841.1 Lrp/AsnC family transcriptional regulator [Bacillus thuringiensis]MEC3573792.1 Lrp/AsnC family transcriptional regulator [Bacillus thuringiensis]MED2143658.1 Lrp/AsnC family transcriptional regulator [Bacillus thuringiensis]MED2520990.1 Lrp/AsnC family transcriptional regulator [Bacillus thuringiensis]
MLDHTDILILEELSQNSRITMKDLGKKIHLTGQATAVRVAKLEDSGIIEAYTIKLNHSKLGCFIHAFINIYTKGIYHEPYLSLLKAKKIHVIKNYKISGDGCFLLECKFSSNELLNQFLTELNKYANYKLSIVINLQ